MWRWFSQEIGRFAILCLSLPGRIVNLFVLSLHRINVFVVTAVSCAHKYLLQFRFHSPAFFGSMDVVFYLLAIITFSNISVSYFEYKTRVTRLCRRGNPQYSNFLHPMCWDPQHWVKYELCNLFLFPSVMKTMCHEGTHITVDRERRSGRWSADCMLNHAYRKLYIRKNWFVSSSTRLKLMPMLMLMMMTIMITMMMMMMMMPFWQRGWCWWSLWAQHNALIGKLVIAILFSLRR